MNIYNKLRYVQDPNYHEILKEKQRNYYNTRYNNDKIFRLEEQKRHYYNNRKHIKKDKTLIFTKLDKKIIISFDWI